MKKVMMTALVAATVSVSIYAQPPAPRGASAVPPPPGGMEARLPVPPKEQALQQVTTFNGRAVKMVTNDDYVYDGFYMVNNGDSVLVKFPPHLGNQIMPLAKEGTSVSVNGVTNTTPFGTKEIRMLSMTAGSKTVADTMMAPATPPLESSVSGSGKITSLQKDREGRVKGFIVNNNIILHFPPQAASQLSSLVNNGSEITYTGMQKPSNNGEVSQGNYKIVHCRTITVNGQQYML